MKGKEFFEEKFSHIEKLKKHLEKVESHLEKEKTFEGKEKIIKEEIKNYLKELQKTPSFASPPSTRDEVEEIRKFEPDQQVGALISLVFEKGLEKAVSLAKALDNPAILDEFHDTLVDRFYEILVKKGILKF